MIPRRRLDNDLRLHCRARGLPEPEPEFRFHPTRRWKFDWAIPSLKLAIEREGVTYSKMKGDPRLGGRHVTAKGFRDDCEKYGEAFALGWTVLRCLPRQIDDGTAANWIEKRLTGSVLRGR